MVATTGAGSTLPSTEIEEDIKVEGTSDVPFGITDSTATIPEGATLPEPTEPVDLSADVIGQPAEVPEGAVLPTEPVAPIEPTEPLEVAPVITPTEPVKTTQEIKQEELDIKATEDAQITAEQEKASNDFTAAITSGNLDAATNLAKQFPEMRDVFNSSIRATFKNQENVEFFTKWNGASNTDMKAAVDSGTLVVGSTQYNLLPADQRKRFEAFNSLNAGQPNNLGEITDQVTSFTDFNTQVDNLFSFDLRGKMEETRNNPEFKNAQGEMSDIKADIDDIDDALFELEEDLEKEFPGMPRSFILAEKAKRSRGLIRDKNSKTRDYNRVLGRYADLKDDLDMDLKIAQFEDQQAKDAFGIKLDNWENRRKEMREDEKLQFVEQSKVLAEQRQLVRQKDLAEFNQKLQEEGLTGGKYLDDGEGNLIYVKGGKRLSVLEGLGDPKDSAEDQNYSYQTVKNKDGTFTLVATPKKDGLNAWFKEVDAQGQNTTPYIKGIGTGEITSHGGEHDSFRGLDIDGNIGDPVTIPMGGKVVQALSDKAFGHTIVVQMNDGNKIRFSHLDTPFVNIGDKVAKGGVIGTLGNTGNVLKLDGTPPSKAELAKGFGSHLDIQMTTKDGTRLSAFQVEEYLNGLGKGSDGLSDKMDEFVSDSDISTFNNSTFKPQNIDTLEQEAKYANFLVEKSAVMGNKHANMEDILKYSRGGKSLTDTSIKSLEKFDSALNQLSAIQEQISDMDTGPVLGRLKSLNPYDTDAQVLKASLTALIPNLARGVYGEVGVLTDNDIRLYTRTIPNLESTAEVNEAILGMTLKIVAGGYKRQLQSLAAAGKDVSGFQGLYDNITGQVDAIETRLGIKDLQPNEATGTFSTTSGYSMNYEQALNAIKTEGQTYNNFFNQP